MPRPGDLVRFRVEAPPGTHAVRLRLDRLPVALVREGPGTTWVGMAAIGRREGPGPRELLVLARSRGPGSGADPGRRSRNRLLRESVPVEERPYPVDRLTVPAHMATPPEPFRYRLFKESATRLFGEGRELGAPELSWSSPVPGKRTSPFGADRYFNGLHRGVHLGVDLRAWTGTPILAPARGRVVSVRKEYLGGNTVRIDHGDGWISHYMHLSETHVSVGTELSRGEPLGAAGATGRVTGPHLHWAVTWRGRYMDPSQLLGADGPEMRAARREP